MTASAVILIPARYDSSRYPGKPLAPVRGRAGHAKPLIQRSWEAACRVPDIETVYVVTDHQSIADTAREFGAKVLMTSARCRNGTERCAEAVDQLDSEPGIVVNLQGDAPLTPPEFVTSLLASIDISSREAVATPCVRLNESHFRQLRAEEAAGRIGGTSVVSDSNGRALYFSKRLIPHFDPDAMPGDLVPVYLHIGVYAYTRAALAAYRAAPPSALEEVEGLEQLRFLDLGIPVRTVQVAPPPWQMWELNNPADMMRIEEGLACMGAD